MLKNSYLLLLLSIFAPFCNASEASNDGPSMFYNPISYWTQFAGSVAQEFANPATKATLDHARDNLQQVGDHLGAVVNDRILPDAELRMRNVSTHAIHEFAKSLVVSVSCAGVALCGTILSYYGIQEYLAADSENDNAKKTKSVIKMGIGASCFAAAIYTVYACFD